MKSKLRIKIIILITLGLLFTFEILIQNSVIQIDGIRKESNEVNNTADQNLNLSRVSGTVHINNNWNVAKSAGLVTGYGNYSDPYIIKDLVINASSSGYGIWIENSNYYLRIENCTIYNSGSMTGDYWIWSRSIDIWWLGGGGIVLSNVNNTIVISNNVSNNYRGILLMNSNNCTISGNEAYKNDDYGIDLMNGFNNIVFGNNVSDHGFLIHGSFAQMMSHNIDKTNLVNGRPMYYYVSKVNLQPNNFSNAGQIYLVNCSRSIVSNLDVSYSTIGVVLFFSNNNTISGNIANNNFYGIAVLHSNFNNISGNIAKYNTLGGIGVDYSNNNFFSENSLDLNAFFGINLNSSNYNLITNNFAYHNSLSGMMFSDSDKNTISGNKVCYNSGYGIQLNTKCNNNVISGNNASHNNGGDGIELSYDCNNNIVSGNNVSYNYGDGIQLGFGSNNNTISGNSANSNYINVYEVWTHGIHLYDCDNNTISGNIANNNTIGIYLEFCEHNEIIGNVAYYNKLQYFVFGDGIRMSYSNYNNISGNVLSNNVGGIYSGYGIYNSIVNNSVNNNIYYGIGCESDRFNSILTNIAKYNVVGIGLLECEFHNVSGNIIDNNIWVGIGLNMSHFNSIFGNIVSNNEIGIYLNQSCWNDVFENIYINNSVIDYFERPTNNCPPNGLIPVAFFTATPTVLTFTNNIVQFQFRGYEGDGPATFQWDFGDGSTISTEKNPSHKYTTPGTYTVALTVIDIHGDSDTLIRVDYIIVPQNPIIFGLYLFLPLGILILVTIIIRKKNKRNEP